MGLSFFMLIEPISDIHAATPIISPSLVNPNHGGPIGNTFLPVPVTITINDLTKDLTPGPLNDHTNVTISSSVSAGFNMTIPESSVAGVFTSTNLAIMTESLFPTIDDKIQFSVVDTTVTPNDNVIQTVGGIIIQSDSETGSFTAGLTPTLVETGKDTNEYTVTFQFGETTNQSTNTLAVDTGDHFTIFDLKGNRFVHGVITPFSAGKGGILVEPGGNLTVTHDDKDSTTITIGGLPGPGRGKIGISVSPSEASLVGRSCRGDCIPPTLGVYNQDKRIVDEGFSYNGNATNVEHYYTPYPLITTNVGEENVAILKIYENRGPQHIKHVELAFGLDEGQIIGNSKAVIEWDRKFDGTETTTVFDPENALEDVRVEADVGGCGTSVIDVECLIVTIYHTFREPLDFNMVGTYVWDFRRNGWQNYYNHGVEIVGESMNPPKQFQISDKGHIINVIQTDKTTGIDENGYIWNFDSRTNSWKKDYVHNHRELLSCDKSIRGYERHCIQFIEEMITQQSIAQNTMSKILVHDIIYWEKLDNIVQSPVGKYLQRSEDPILQNSIIQEQLKAEQKFEGMYDRVNNWR